MRPDAEAEPAGARAVCVIGPGGMGKTRLTLETARRLGLTPIACSCSRMQRNVSLHPFRGLLEGACAMDADDPAEVRLEKLRAALSSLPGAAETGASGDLPFLAAVFDIPLDRLSAPQRGAAGSAAPAGAAGRRPARPRPRRRRARRWSSSTTCSGPTSPVWTCSPCCSPCPRLKITIAARDGFEPPWAETVVRRIVLDPLDEDATAELVRQTPSAARLSPERSRELMAAQRRRAAVPRGAAADRAGVGLRAASRTGRCSSARTRSRPPCAIRCWPGCPVRRSTWSWLSWPP